MTSIRHVSIKNTTNSRTSTGNNSKIPSSPGKVKQKLNNLANQVQTQRQAQTPYQANHFARDFDEGPPPYSHLHPQPSLQSIDRQSRTISAIKDDGYTKTETFFLSNNAKRVSAPHLQSQFSTKKPNSTSNSKQQKLKKKKKKPKNCDGNHSKDNYTDPGLYIHNGIRKRSNCICYRPDQLKPHKQQPKSPFWSVLASLTSSFKKIDNLKSEQSNRENLGIEPTNQNQKADQPQSQPQQQCSHHGLSSGLSLFSTQHQHQHQRNQSCQNFIAPLKRQQSGRESMISMINGLAATKKQQQHRIKQQNQQLQEMQEKFQMQSNSRKSKQSKPKQQNRKNTCQRQKQPSSSLKINNFNGHSSSSGQSIIHRCHQQQDYQDEEGEKDGSQQQQQKNQKHTNDDNEKKKHSKVQKLKEMIICCFPCFTYCGCCKNISTFIPSRIRSLLSSITFQIFIAILTICSLFMQDFRTIFIDKQYDYAIDYLNIIFFATFALEILMSLTVQGYVFSFFFYLDVVSTLSICMDITIITDMIYNNGGNSQQLNMLITQSKASRAAARAVRIMKIFRLARVVKLYKSALKTKQLNEHKQKQLLKQKLRDKRLKRKIGLGLGASNSGSHYYGLGLDGSSSVSNLGFGGSRSHRNSGRHSIKNFTGFGTGAGACGKNSMHLQQNAVNPNNPKKNFNAPSNSKNFLKLQNSLALSCQTSALQRSVETFSEQQQQQQQHLNANRLKPFDKIDQEAFNEEISSVSKNRQHSQQRQNWRGQRNHHDNGINANNGGQQNNVQNKSSSSFSSSSSSSQSTPPIGDEHDQDDSQNVNSDDPKHNAAKNSKKLPITLNPQQQSNISKILSQSTIKKIIMVILIIMFSITAMDIKNYYPPSTSWNFLTQYVAELLGNPEIPVSYINQMISKKLQKFNQLQVESQVVTIDTPFNELFSFEVIGRGRGLRITEISLAQTKIDIESVLRLRPCLSLRDYDDLGMLSGNNYTSNVNTTIKPNTDTNANITIFTSQSIQYYNDNRLNYITVVLSVKRFNRIDSWFSIAKIIFICLTIVYLLQSFNANISNLIVTPIEKMLEIIINPLKSESGSPTVTTLQTTQQDNPVNDPSYYRHNQHNNHHLSKSSASQHMSPSITFQQAHYQTNIVQKAIVKIRGLMSTVFGKIGMDMLYSQLFVNNNISDEESSSRLPLQTIVNMENYLCIKNKIYCIYAICRIHNFVEIAETLKCDSFAFINQIAHIVHSSAYRYGGNGVKNLTDGFLIVFKLPQNRQKEIIQNAMKAKVSKNKHNTYLSILSDFSIYSMAKTLIRLHKEPMLLKFKKDQRILKKFGNNFNIEMSFSVGIGESIQGIAGSQFKIDPIYLGGKVSQVEKISKISHKYPNLVIMEKEIYNNLTIGLQRHCRIMDLVKFNDYEEGKSELYALDLDLQYISPSCSKTDKYKKKQDQPDIHLKRQLNMECLKDSIEINNYDAQTFIGSKKQLREVFKRIMSQENKQKYKMAFRFYRTGEWLQAKYLLEDIMRVTKQDVLTKRLYTYISERNFKCKDLANIFKDISQI